MVLPPMVVRSRVPVEGEWKFTLRPLGGDDAEVLLEGPRSLRHRANVSQARSGPPRQPESQACRLPPERRRVRWPKADDSQVETFSSLRSRLRKTMRTWRTPGRSPSAKS